MNEFAFNFVVIVGALHGICYFLFKEKDETCYLSAALLFLLALCIK